VPFGFVLVRVRVPTFTPERKGGVAHAAAEVEPGAGALELDSEKRGADDRPRGLPKKGPSQSATKARSQGRFTPM
jgi:hypothetical protein